MTSKFSISTREHEYFLEVDGSHFPFANAAEKIAAGQACAEHAFLLQRTIESKIGRQLTSVEATRGFIARPDTRTPLQKIDQQAKWQSILNPPKTDEGNPFDAKIAALQRKRAEEQDPEMFALQQGKEAYERGQAEAQAKIARDADPLRQNAVGKCRALLTASRFDDRCGVGDLEALQNILALSQDGDFRQAASLASEWKKGYAERLKQLAAPDVASALERSKEVAEMQKPLVVDVQPVI
jgi:hypothetical protein